MAGYSLCWRSPRHDAAQQASNAPALSTPSASQGAGASKTTPVSCPLPVEMENSLCLEDPSVVWALMGVTSAAGQDCSLLRAHSSPFEVTDGRPVVKRWRTMHIIAHFSNSVSLHMYWQVNGYDKIRGGNSLTAASWTLLACLRSGDQQSVSRAGNINSRNNTFLPLLKCRFMSGMFLSGL